MDLRPLILGGLVALAGCVAPAAPPAPGQDGPGDAAAGPGSGDAAAPAGPTLAWDLRDCFFAYAAAVAPAERLQALLPPGFTLRSGLPFGLGPPAPPAVPQVVGNLGIEVDDCASGQGLHGPVAPMQYAHFWVGTTPPPELAEPGVPGFAAFDFLVPDADRRALFQAAGYPARDGAIAVTQVLPPDPLQVQEVAWDMEGLGALRMTIHEDLRGLPQFNGTVAHFVEAADGSLSRWRYDWRTTVNRQGWGTVEVPGGTWLSDLFGSTTVPVRIVYGRWDYTNGTIALGV